MSTPLFKKLNWKNQPQVWVIDAPESFRTDTDQMAEFAEVKSGIPTPADKPQFIISFSSKKQDLDRISIALLPALDRNTVLWFAYPKGTSKKYKCDYNRDKGWDVIASAGYQGVRMISIDDDWSALRFKKQ